MKDFSDKTATVTGVGSATAAAFASELAARGAHVAADIDMGPFGCFTRSLDDESGINRFVSHR